jgi:meso-butanediol dehydrogenase/(S,S)-butanediol dehydrogenase/diacetyl reductase
VSRSSQVAHLVDTTVEAYGTVSVLFNNAGIVYFGTVLQTDEKTWEKVIAVNLTGTYLCSRAVLPHMIRNGGGSIINMTSSTGAHDAGGNSAAYVASKGGVALLTRAMAIDHAKEGVRVNAIAPGPTDTHMLSDNMEREALNAFVRSTIPMNRLGKPEEQACVALFLASDEASFVTGAIFAVDGGQTALV